MLCNDQGEAKDSLDSANVLMAEHTTFVENVVGPEHLWILGDNFTSRSYRTYFRRQEGDFFIKDHYEFAAQCNSRWSSSNENMLSR